MCVLSAASRDRDEGFAASALKPSGVSGNTWPANVGNGSQEIVDIQPDTMVKSKLMFDGFDTPSYATFTLQPTDKGTRVSWAFDANMDTMIGRYMGLMMDKWVGGDYERGLARLKELAEQAD